MGIENILCGQSGSLQLAVCVYRVRSVDLRVAEDVPPRVGAVPGGQDGPGRPLLEPGQPAAERVAGVAASPRRPRQLLAARPRHRHLAPRHHLGRPRDGAGAGRLRGHGLPQHCQVSTELYKYLFSNIFFSNDYLSLSESDRSKNCSKGISLVELSRSSSHLSHSEHSDELAEEEKYSS